MPYSYTYKPRFGYSTFFVKCAAGEDGRLQFPARVEPLSALNLVAGFHAALEERASSGDVSGVALHLYRVDHASNQLGAIVDWPAVPALTWSPPPTGPRPATPAIEDATPVPTLEEMLEESMGLASDAELESTEMTSAADATLSSELERDEVANAARVLEAADDPLLRERLEAAFTSLYGADDLRLPGDDFADAQLLVTADILAAHTRWHVELEESRRAMLYASNAGSARSDNISLLIENFNVPCPEGPEPWAPERRVGHAIFVHWHTHTTGQRVYLDESDRVKFSMPPLASTPIGTRPTGPGRVPVQHFEDARVLVWDTGVEMRKPRGMRPMMDARAIRLQTMWTTALLARGTHAPDTAARKQPAACAICGLVTRSAGEAEDAEDAEVTERCALCLQHFHGGCAEWLLPKCQSLELASGRTSELFAALFAPTFYDACCAMCRNATTAWMD